MIELIGLLMYVAYVLVVQYGFEKISEFYVWVRAGGPGGEYD
jgi:hypothetical protein